MGSIRIRDSGLWKAPIELWVRDAGIWKQPEEMWLRYQGNWVQVFSEAPGPIGSEFQGGYYFGQFSETQDGNATHYLVVAPKANAIVLGESLRSFSGFPATDLGDGPTSSATLAGFGFDVAVACENAFINGYSDWYLGAIKEYEIFYYNLKPNTQNNNTTSGFGDNPYAVPSRAGGAYTTTIPAATSVPEFLLGGSEHYSVLGCLSSSSTGNNLYFWSILTSSSVFNGRQSIVASLFGSIIAPPIRRVPI